MLKRLWEWLDIADRLSFAWGVIVAAKAKVAVMVVAFGSAGWLDGMLVGLVAGGIAWVILNVSALKRVVSKIRKPTEHPTQQPSEVTSSHFLPSVTETGADAHLAGILRTMLTHDRQNQGDCLRIRPNRIDWSNSNPPKGSAWIDFHWDIYSSTLLTLEFEQQPSGHIRYYMEKELTQIGTIERLPELMGELLMLPLLRTQEADLVIRQYLPAEVWTDFRNHPTDTVVFRFDDVRIHARATAPDTTDDAIWRLQVPSPWSSTIPLY